MCKSELNACFTKVLDPLNANSPLTHGCLDPVANAADVCVSSSRGADASAAAAAATLECCHDDMCNYRGLQDLAHTRDAAGKRRKLSGCLLFSASDMFGPCGEKLRFPPPLKSFIFSSVLLRRRPVTRRFLQTLCCLWTCRPPLPPPTRLFPIASFFSELTLTAPSSASGKSATSQFTLSTWKDIIYVYIYILFCVRLVIAGCVKTYHVGCFLRVGLKY